MMASGPVTPSLPSAPFRRVHQEAAVRHRADIDRQDHLASSERRASFPLRMCVRDKACQARGARHTLQKSLSASVFQKIDSGFAESRALGNHDGLTTLDSAARPWIHADERGRSIDDSSDSPVKTAVTVPVLRCEGALEQVFFH